MTKPKAIDAAQHERAFQVFEDTKKTFVYDKHAGQWAWVDRDERDNPEAYHGGHKTAWAAVLEAVEPYLEDADNG